MGLDVDITLPLWDLLALVVLSSVLIGTWMTNWFLKRCVVIEDGDPPTDFRNTRY